MSAVNPSALRSSPFLAMSLITSARPAAMASVRTYLMMSHLYEEERRR
jgi:hypothetical protein